MIIKAFKNCENRTPIWFMRQAGRYLPEFKKIRKKNNNFIKLCLNSKLSCDLSLQPIERFDMDAAIIFSDILMIPFGLGQKINFLKGKGPILGNLNLDEIISTDSINFTKKLNPIYKAISMLRRKLDKKKPLIAFVGSPWTLAVYMLHKQSPSKFFNLNTILKDDYTLNLLLNKLHEVSCLHIENQIKAGANIIQLFDSWAGLLNKKNLEKNCYIPNLKLVNFIRNKKKYSICFPKGIKKNYKEFVKIVKPDCINIDYEINPKWALKNFRQIPIQGGLDPKLLLNNDKILIKKVYSYLNTFKKYPYIFNLGHGILPNTEPAKVSKIVNIVREFKK